MRRLAPIKSGCEHSLATRIQADTKGLVLVFKLLLVVLVALFAFDWL